MATFISVPLKKSSEVDLVKPLSKFVTASYPAGEEQAEYIRAVEELNKLRRNALGRPLDKHESSLEVLLRRDVEASMSVQNERTLSIVPPWLSSHVACLPCARYYDQLCAVEPKFPFSENQLCLTFTWKDAFDKGSLFGGSVKLALASLGYEKTCVLFNAAALASQIASEQNLDSDEGLKAAAKYYQLASGAFGHIKDTVLSALNREPTMDISPETVGTLSLIMLAQAQEVFFLKATSDKMKDAVIAKLANQAADFYGDAFKQCQYKDNLPKDLSGDSIPQSIAEKARSIVQQGGLQSIEQLIKDLPELLTRNREILDESLKMLDDEETTDNELRTKFNQRWNRTPSGDLYKPLRAEGANFRNILDKAVQADQVVKERYSTHCDMITLLCKPENELNAAIPSANPTKTLQGSENKRFYWSVLTFTQVVNVLRSQLAQLDEMKKERESLEGEVKAVTFDMSTTFLTALAQDGAINEEQLSLSQLDQLYGAYNQRVQASLRMQEDLLAQVQTSHQEFSSLKQSNTEANQREEVLKKLASAHDSYVEISSNLREGTKFYNDLTEILIKFQNKCSDIVFARKTERDELLKYVLAWLLTKSSFSVFDCFCHTHTGCLEGELQQSIAREPSAPSFNVPAYQSTPAAPAAGPTPAPRTVFQPQAKPQPPARPPPPTVTPQAASTTPTTAPPTGPPSSNPPPVAPPTQAQGPPYPTYQGYPGYFQMPMGYNPYAAYGQYNMPNMPNMPYMPYQGTPGQAGYPAAPPAGQPYPGYPQQPPQHQPYYPQQ
eukprot:superscaffoldBa00003158_g16258